MAPEMYTALAAIVGALLGTYAGFKLSEKARRNRECESQQWIREMISSEMNYNLENLDSNRSALPTRSVQIWDKQLPNAIGTSSKNQFVAVRRFY